MPAGKKEWLPPCCMHAEPLREATELRLAIIAYDNSGDRQHMPALHSMRAGILF